MKDLPRDEADVLAAMRGCAKRSTLARSCPKEQLKDVDNATESFEVLDDRFEEVRYPQRAIISYTASTWKRSKVDGSPWKGSAHRPMPTSSSNGGPIRSSPDWCVTPTSYKPMNNASGKEEEAYRGIYQQFRQYSYIPVVNACDVVLREEPRNHFRPKYHILKAMALGGLRDMGNYRSTLNELRSTYPGTDEAKAADEMLAALDKAAGGTVPPRAEGSSASYTMGDGSHFYVVVVPNKDNDLNTIKDSDRRFRTGLSALRDLPRSPTTSWTPNTNWCWWTGWLTRPQRSITACSSRATPMCSPT